MSTIHVRDVSPAAVSTLKIRAASAGQSLQAYVRLLLEQQAMTLTSAEAAEQAREIARRGTVSADDVLAALDESREQRP